MIRMAKQVSAGVKCKTILSEKKSNHKPHRQHYTIDAQNRIDICLNCTKPASECKGNCFGGHI